MFVEQMTLEDVKYKVPIPPPKAPKQQTNQATGQSKGTVPPSRTKAGKYAGSSFKNKSKAKPKKKNEFLNFGLTPHLHAEHLLGMSQQQ